MSDRLTDEELRREIADRLWYHTLELRPGIETPGWFDLRRLRPSIPISDRLEGKRCLDIGTFDGFWAFEMERAGASEVLAIDILDPRQWDWPANSREATVAAIGERKAAGTGFEIAHRELASSVERLELSVHDLDPSRHGRFDQIYLGSLLLHLRDPIGALMRVRDVCSGEFVVCDAVDAPLSAVFRRRPLAELDGNGRPWWWKPNLAGLVRMTRAAGFEPVSPPVRVRMPPGSGHPRPRWRPSSLTSHAARIETMRAWRGDPHAVMHLRPTAI